MEKTPQKQQSSTKLFGKISTKRNLLVSIAIGIIMITLAPYIYVSILNQSITDPFFTECLDIKYHRKINYTSFCIEREQTEYLSCILSIPPSKAKKKHVLVVGSRTPIGMSLVWELKNREIPYVEIKGKAHIDLNAKESYDIIKSVQYCAIFVCVEKLDDPAYLQAMIRNLKIPTYSFSPELGLRDYTITIDTPKIVGPQFMGLQNDFWNIIVQRCNLLENPVINELNQNFIGSKTAASLVLEKVLPYIYGISQDYPKQITLQPTTTLEKVLKTVAAKYPKCYIRMNGRKVYGEIDDEAQEAIDFAASQYSTTNEAYLSLVFIANELDDSTEFMNKELAWIDDYVKRYPSTPIEIVIVMLTHTKGMNVIYPRENIKSHVKVILVPSEKAPEDNSNPEYIMRNIGIRRATGRFIVAARADNLVPISLLDAARRHELSAMAIIRSEKLVGYMKYEQARTMIIPQPATQQLLSWKDPYLDIGGHVENHGILQGCHQKLWKAIGGYAEGPWYSDVDSALMLEFPTITDKTYVQRFAGTVSYMNTIKPTTSGFPNIKKISSMAACKGISPKKIVGAKTKNWGMSNKKFKILTY